MQILTKGKEDLRDKILDTAQKLFTKYGIRNVTMQDIGKELGISKKTIYQFFIEKKELVFKTVERMYVHDLQELEAYCAKAKDALEELLIVSQFNGEMLQKIDSTFWYDIQKYYDEVWLFCKHQDNDYIVNQVTKNLERGIREGLYRSDLNIPFLASFVIAQNQVAFDEQFFPRTQFTLTQIQAEMMEHFIRGIVTLQGFNKLEEYKNQQTL